MPLIDQIDFSCLPPRQKRRFVPEDAGLTELAEISGLYDRLLAREIASADDLEQWLLDRSELEAAVDQRRTVLYIRMTCQTDDAARAKDYKDFIEKIDPVLKPLADKLDAKYLAAAERIPPDEARYGVYTRAVRTDRELFVEANIPLQTQVALLSQEYQSLCGAMTVSFEGRERTLAEMHKFLLEPDRGVREKAWEASAKRRLQDRERLDELFDKMLGLRTQIARSAGFDNFRDYMFKAMHRFDYTPQDCRDYHGSVERLLVPLWRRILEKRREQMKLGALRPWDTAVDALGRPPLKPFEKVTDLIEGCRAAFDKVDTELGAQFAGMAEAGLLDLESRKGKAPGGYQSTLNEARRPFIFMNAVGVDGDVWTLLHEGGHAFHAMACAHDPLLDYRHGPMEFNEVASMGMELLASPHLNGFYNKDDAARARGSHFKDIIFILTWVATIDAFQHWIYENPEHTGEQRRDQWKTIRKRFSGGVVDWDGLDEERAYLWHRQLHIFEVPFYYIEYGIAQLGALQLWLNSKKDFGNTVAAYRRALSLGGARPLPELFAAAGLRFDFSAATIAPLVEAVGAEIL